MNQHGFGLWIARRDAPVLDRVSNGARQILDKPVNQGLGFELDLFVLGRQFAAHAGIGTTANMVVFPLSLPLRFSDPAGNFAGSTILFSADPDRWSVMEKAKGVPLKPDADGYYHAAPGAEFVLVPRQ